MKNLLVCLILCVLCGCCSREPIRPDIQNSSPHSQSPRPTPLGPFPSLSSDAQPPLSEVPSVSQQSNSPPNDILDDLTQAMIGKRIDTLINNYGLPDTVESSHNYGTRFTAGTAEVVFNYNRMNKAVYLTRDCVILGVFDIEAPKE